jgi:hypothetical protein
MDIYNYWTQALKKTEIVRPRVQAFLAQEDTLVPYIMLSESSVNLGDTVVRKGEVLVQKPALFLPPASPQLDGFEFSAFEEDDSDASFKKDAFLNFLLVRGVTLPSMKYNNTTNSLEVFDGDLPKAVGHFGNLLQRQENVATGLIVGPEEGWQFSVLVYICSQVARNADADIRNLLKDFKNHS